jgi:hypothetical protein
MANFKSISIKVLIGLVVLMLATGSFIYWGNYSRGTRAGSIMKVSQKGVVIKTWEGLLDVGTINDPWAFSVYRSDRDIQAQLDSASTTGERVKLHYVEKFLRVPWRGDTRYFITKVERNVPDRTEKREGL